jgi:hypothetical protein
MGIRYTAYWRFATAGPLKISATPLQKIHGRGHSGQRRDIDLL